MYLPTYFYVLNSSQKLLFVNILFINFNFNLPGKDVWIGRMSRRPVPAGFVSECWGSEVPRRSMGNPCSSRGLPWFLRRRIHPRSPARHALCREGPQSTIRRPHGTIHRSSARIYLYVLHQGITGKKPNILEIRTWKINDCFNFKQRRSCDLNDILKSICIQILLLIS